MIEREILFEVPRHSIPTDYNLDEGYYQCPHCGQFKLWKEDRTRHGQCKNCGEHYRFTEKTQTFVQNIKEEKQ